jgi:hypothetical protein
MAFEAGSAFVKENTEAAAAFITHEVIPSFKTLVEVELDATATFKLYGRGERDAADPTSATKDGMTQIAIEGSLDAQTAGTAVTLASGYRWITLELLTEGGKLVTTQVGQS